MKIIKEGKQDTTQDLYVDNYEFRLCGGAVDPKDSKLLKKDVSARNAKQKR